MTKLITIPETVTIRNLSTDVPLKIQEPNSDVVKDLTVSFYNFLVSTLLKDPAFGANAVTIMHAIDIKDAVKNASPGDVIEVEKEAFALLEQVLNQPANPFNPEVALQLGTFFKAILKAKDKEAN